jgi:ABC-2 type transport system permease protein
MLSILDHRAEVTLLLGGDLNAGFRRLKKATEETLEELAVYADIRVKDGWSAAQENGLMDSLGLRPIVIHEREQNGKTAQTTVYPYAIIEYNGKRAVVTLLKNTRGLSGEENLNASIEQLEFAFMEALHLLQQTETPRVAILEGHGEPDEAHTFDLMSALSKYFQVDRGSVTMNELTNERVNVHILDGYKAVIVLNPQTAFSEAERFVIDQYIMRGGAVLWSLNGVKLWMLVVLYRAARWICKQVNVKI